MRHMLIFCALAALCVVPALGAELTVPGLEQVWETAESCGVDRDATLDQGLSNLFRDGLEKLNTLLRASLSAAAKLVAVVLLCALAGSARAGEESGLMAVTVAGALAITALTMTDMSAMIGLGRDTMERMEEFSSLSLEVYHGEDIYVCNPNEITFAHLEKVNCDYTQCAIADMPTPWVKAILHQEREVLAPVQTRLLDRYPGRYEAIFSNPRYLELTRKGSSKGGGIARVAQMLNVTPEHIYCVGDNQNDIPMLERSAIPFAPANCAQEVKDWGARVLCHCNDGVIGDVVDILDRLDSDFSEP